jgi:hypothetical protein
VHHALTVPPMVGEHEASGSNQLLSDYLGTSIMIVKHNMVDRYNCRTTITSSIRHQVLMAMLSQWWVLKASQRNTLSLSGMACIKMQSLHKASMITLSEYDFVSGLQSGVYMQFVTRNLIFFLPLPTKVFDVFPLFTS